jgi:hypothetical protein
MAFPVDANLIDDFNGLNGVHLDAWQPTKWAAGPLYGPPSGTWWWQINSSHASPAAESANHLSLFQMPADFELYFDLSVVAVSSGYLAMFFSVQNGGTSGWEGYWFIWTIGGAFAINKHVAGVTTPLATLPSSPFAQGDKIGLKRLGAAIQIYRRIRRAAPGIRRRSSTSRTPIWRRRVRSRSRARAVGRSTTSQARCPSAGRLEAVEEVRHLRRQHRHRRPSM